MTTDTAPAAAHPWVRRTLDALASLAAVYAVGALAINKLDTMIAFFGETSSVEAYHVSDYRTWVSVLAASLVVLVLAGVGPVAYVRWPLAPAAPGDRGRRPVRRGGLPRLHSSCGPAH